MIHPVESSNSIVKGTSLFSGLLFAAIVVFHPVSAHAQCAAWEATGHMILRQAGSKAMDIDLVQKGKLITGTAESIVRNVDNDGEKRMSGKIDGTLDGDIFSVQIYWLNNQTGVYNGKVLLSGRLDGEAYEKRSPNVRVPWHTEGVLTCAPPPRPKPIRSSGKARPVEAPPTPPFITATQPVRLPDLTFSSVTLGWDGGPDHPNAEVWVSTNSQAEISAALVYGTVMKQPRIPSFELKLPRGLYKFFVKDAGSTLSTVVVEVP